MGHIKDIASMLDNKRLMLFSPKRVKCSFCNLLLHVCKTTTIHSVKKIIIYGSFLYEKKPNDVDVLVIIDDYYMLTGVDKNKNKIIPRLPPRYEKRMARGWVPHYQNSNIQVHYEAIQSIMVEPGNPHTIDMSFRTESEIRKEILYNGISKNHCAVSALKTGLIIYEKEKEDYGIKNENIYELKKKFLCQNYKIVRKIWTR
jgi:hypothetical protein